VLSSSKLITFEVEPLVVIDLQPLRSMTVIAIEGRIYK
jgi:hypothetical protein